jgi:hypothetical protein
LNARYNVIGAAIVIAIASQKPYQTFVYHGRSYDFDPGDLTNAFNQTSGVSAATVNEVADSRTPKGANRRIGGKPAASP